MTYKPYRLVDILTLSEIKKIEESEPFRIKIFVMKQLKLFVD